MRAGRGPSRAGSRGDAALRALVNGVLWPGFTGVRAPDWLKAALDEGLAGVVYFAPNLDPDRPEQPVRLSADLRSIRPEALIGVDEEGGSVTRLEATHGSTIPGAAQLGRVDDTALTRLAGEELGRRVRSAGANVVLAPVADVNTDPANPVIGVRSFGSSADVVSRHVIAAVEGMQSQGVAACLKHFPGHGDTRTDSHLGLPRVDLPWSRMEAEHLPPFAAGVRAGACAVLTAHIVVPELGEEPATVNVRALARLRAMGFDGVIVTDALDMAAIRATYGLGPGAVHAIRAGADLLCLGNPANRPGTADVDDYLEAREALFDALDDGSLPIRDLERSAASVRSLAEAVRPVTADGPLEENAAASDAFREAIECLCRGDTEIPHAEGPATVLDVRGRPSLAVASGDEPFTAALSRLRPTAYLRADGDSTDDALARIAPDRSLVVLADALAADGEQRRLVETIGVRRPDAVVINAGLFAEPGVLPLPIVNCLAASRLSAEVVARLLAR